MCSVQYLNSIVYSSQKLLEEEFLDSPSGLTVPELMLRTSKYENGRFSYWRSEERRRVSKYVCYTIYLLIQHQWQATVVKAFRSMDGVRFALFLT